MRQQSPEDLIKFIESLTTQLLIKAGQKIPKDIISKLDILKEYD